MAKTVLGNRNNTFDWALAKKREEERKAEEKAKENSLQSNPAGNAVKNPPKSEISTPLEKGSSRGGAEISTPLGKGSVWQVKDTPAALKRVTAKSSGQSSETGDSSPLKNKVGMGRDVWQMKPYFSENLTGNGVKNPPKSKISTPLGKGSVWGVTEISTPLGKGSSGVWSKISPPLEKGTVLGHDGENPPESEISTPLGKGSSSDADRYTVSKTISGRSHYGLNFEASKQSDSFINSNSPFAGYKITSKTGARNPRIKGASTNHAGIDRAVPEGTFISLPIDTVFIGAGYDNARGNWIEVQDSKGNILHYQHLKDYGDFTVGQSIPRGQKIARSGSTGVGTAHLHEEYYSPEGVNITESYWAKYAAKTPEAAAAGVSAAGRALSHAEIKAYDMLTLADDSMMLGLTEFNKAFYGMTDMLGAAIKKGLSFVGKDVDAPEWYKTMRNETTRLNREYSERVEGETQSFTSNAGRGGAIFVSSAASNAVQMIPTIVTSVLSGVGSLAQTVGKPVSTAGGKLLGKLTDTLSQPQFWTSYIQQTGSAYNEAKESGASEKQSWLAATISGFINSVIETSGGIETELATPAAKESLMKNLWRILSKTAPEEAVEEGLQDVVSGLVNKFTYKYDAPWMSYSDENAVYNPERMGNSMAMGYALGGMFGGGNLAASSIISHITQGKSVSDAYGKMSDSEKEEFKAAAANIQKKAQSGYYDNMTNEQLAKDEDAAKVKEYAERYSVGGESPEIEDSAHFGKGVNVGRGNPPKSEISTPLEKGSTWGGTEVSTPLEKGSVWGGTEVSDALEMGSKDTSGRDSVTNGKGVSNDNRSVKLKADTRLFPTEILKDFNRARAHFVNYWNNNMRKNVVIKETGVNVRISRKGIDKFLSGNLTYEKYATGFSIPELLENANLVASEEYVADKAYGKPKENIVSYSYYDNEISVDGKEYKTHIRVRHTASGNSYYGHTVSEVDEIKIEPSMRTDGTSVPSWPVKEINGSVDNISQNGGNVNSKFAEDGKKFGETQRKFFEMFGLTVETDEALDANARIILSEGRVIVSPFAKIDDWEITRHEFTHYLKETEPEAYRVYEEAVRTELADRWDGYYDEVKRDYETYAENHPDMVVNDEVICEEIMARYAEGLDNNDFIEKMANEKPSIAARIRNALKRIIDRIKATFTRTEFRDNAQSIRKIIDAKTAWENAAVRAAGRKSSNSTNSISTDRKNADSKFSVTEDEGEQGKYTEENPPESKIPTPLGKGSSRGGTEISDALGKGSSGGDGEYSADLEKKQGDRVQELEKENARLKEANDILKRFFRETGMVHVDALHISEIAERVKSTYQSHMPAREIGAQLQSIYTKMTEDGAKAESDTDRMQAANDGAEALFGLANKILEQSDAVDRTMYNRYADLRNELRRTGISISARDAQDIADFNDFRRKNIGRVKITADGVPVDTFYEQLMEVYPELFASDDITAPSDRLKRIAEVRDMLDPRYRDNSYTDEEASALAVELYAEYFSDRNASFEQQSLAAMIKDKYAKALRETYNEKLKKTVDFYREQVDFYKNLNRHVQERIADVEKGEPSGGFVDEEVQGVPKNFKLPELKGTGVKFVRRRSPEGKKNTYLLTFERATRENLRSNEEYRQIITRVKNRINGNWQEGKDAKSQLGYSRSNIWRSFRRFFGDRDYAKMKELVLDPFEDSKKQYLYIQEFYSNLIYENVVKKLGIKKGSKLSALVQKYGEKTLTEQELEKISEKDMQKIKAADRIFRECYDGLIDTINDTRRAIYPGVDERSAQLEQDILKLEKEIGLIELGFMTGDFSDVAGFDNFRLERIAIRKESAKELAHRISLNAQQRAADYDAKIRKTEQEMSGKKNKTTKKYAELAERLARYQTEKAKYDDLAELKQSELSQKVEELNQEFTSNTQFYKQKLDKRLADLNMRLGEKKAALEADEISYGRTIEKRKDYYRHFADLAAEIPAFQSYIQQMTQDNGKTVFQAAKDYLDKRGERYNIDNRVAGKSSDTKPRAKWQSFAQHRAEGSDAPVKYDAVGGFLEYLPAAAYSAAIDPQISIFRTIAEDLAAKVDIKDNKKLGSFIGYLQEYANDLAGKTHAIDRVIADALSYRDIWNKFNWVIGRIKSNMVTFNVSSSIAQILNLPNAIATIKNPKFFIGAMGDTIAGMFDKNSAVADRYKYSQFLNERYNNYYSRFNTGFWKYPKAVGDWMLQVFDELGGRVIWNAAYRSALSKKYPSAVRYADDLTRRMIGGRQIGEMQLYQKSKMLGMLMPFSVEVSNNWDVIEDIVRDAAKSGRKYSGVAKAAVAGGSAACGIVLLMLANYMFNAIIKSIRGTDGGLLDPIEAVMDGVENGGSVWEIAGSVAGNALGATPIGASVAALYPEQGMQLGDISTPTRSELFGSNDPTRYGTGNIFTSAFKKPFNYLVMPGGGSQLDKTVTGHKALKDAAVKKKNGDVLYEVDNKNPSNVIRGYLFGKSGFTETQAYYDTKDSKGVYETFLMPTMGFKRTEQQKELLRLTQIDDSLKVSNPAKKFTYNDIEYNTSGEKYDTYREMYGRRANQYYNRIMLSDEYKAANDTVKIAMVKEAYSNALKDAKGAYVKWIKSGAKKGEGSLEGEFTSDFIGKKIVGNGDAAEEYHAEGFNSGKGYAEVETGGEKFILQGDAYNAYEKARYDSYTKVSGSLENGGTIVIQNPSRNNSMTSKLRSIIVQRLQEGTIERQEAVDILTKYAKGEAVEVPAVVEFAAGKKEQYTTDFDNLTAAEKQTVFSKLKTKVKNGEITRDEYLKMREDIMSGRQQCTVMRYITGEFRSLSEEQQEKILSGINDTAKVDALEAVKGRLK